MSFKDLSPWFKEVFVLIDATCREMGIPLYLIGAQARHFHLVEKGIKPGRGTMDIDFAIMLPDIGTYDRMLDRLIGKGFRKVTEPYRIIHDRTNTVVDLLPFGEVEEKGTVKFTDRKTELSVVGFRDVLKTPDLKKLDDDITIQVTPLEGIIIMKLISFEDKPERTKDLDDIYDILIHYFELNDKRFYENLPEFLDEFSEADFQLEAGAWLAGCDIGKILAVNGGLRDHILQILENELEKDIGRISRYYYNKDYFQDIDKIKRIFERIMKGINS
jgi:predicted nucleotidyltransferase